MNFDGRRLRQRRSYRVNFARQFGSAARITATATANDFATLIRARWLPGRDQRQLRGRCDPQAFVLSATMLAASRFTTSVIVGERGDSLQAAFQRLRRTLDVKAYSARQLIRIAKRSSLPRLELSLRPKLVRIWHIDQRR